MSENDKAQWWRDADRRAYTYPEKKLNRLSNREMYDELYGVKIDKNELRSIKDDELDMSYLSERRINKLVKHLEKKWTDEEYEKTIEQDDIFNGYCLALTLRDETPYKLTNSEAWCIAVNVIYLTLEDLLENIDEHRDALKQNKNHLIDMMMKKTHAVIADMYDNWKYYMDTAPQAVDKTRTLLARHKSKDHASVIIQ